MIAMQQDFYFTFLKYCFQYMQTLTSRTKPSSGSVTFRFDNETLNQLRNEGNEKRISLNTLASQIFQSHVEYDTYAS